MQDESRTLVHGELVTLAIPWGFSGAFLSRGFDGEFDYRYTPVKLGFDLVVL
jgi:hypothetical protein